MIRTESHDSSKIVKEESLAYILGRERFESTREMARVQRLKERICSVETVLSLDLERLRQAVPVCTNLHAKANPKLTSAKKPLLAKHSGAIEQVLFEQTISPYTVATLPKVALCINDKLMPHSALDFMAISGDATCRTFSDLTLKTQAELFRLFSRFGVFCEQRNLYPTIAFTSDPKTKDRITAQGTGRFHAHFIARNRSDVTQVKNCAVPLSSFSRLEQRRLVDEYTIVASLCMTDRLKNLSFGSLNLLPPFEGLPKLPSLSFKVAGGWDGLMRNETLQEFQKLVAVYTETFRRLQSIISYGSEGDWQRPQLREVRTEVVRQNIMSRIAALDWFSPDVLRVLDRFLLRLSPRIVAPGRRYLSNPSYTSITSHTYPLMGSVYSAGFALQGANLRLTFAPTLFSDTGGAGVCPIDGVVTRTCRGEVGYLTAQEMAERASFQSDAVEFMCRRSTAVRV